MTGNHVVGVKCPDCRQETVVYNGNYYCDACPWAMSEDDDPKTEYIIKTYLIQRLKKAQDIGNDEEVQRMSFHLINGGYVENGEEL